MRRLNLSFVVIAAAVLAGFLCQQRAPAQSANSDWEKAAGGKMTFDVVSVKPNKSDELPRSVIPLGPGDTYSPNGGPFSATHQPLLVYIMFAYKITSLNDLDGIPDWVRTEHFDIDARSAGNPTKDQMRLMLRAVLADRFKLIMRVEAKNKHIFMLVLSRPGRLGPDFQRSSAESCAAVAADGSDPQASAPSPQAPSVHCGDFTVVQPSAPARIRVVGKNVPIELIARQLPSGTLAGVDRPVLDGTGLTGSFDFSIEWTPRLPIQPPEFVTDDPGPTFLQALNDQLGLKLVPRSGPMNLFVIDHIEKPSPN